MFNTNRDTAIQASGGLSMQSFQQFKDGGTANMMRTMAKFPGSIYGTPQDLVSMFAAAPSLGASYNFGAQGDTERGREGNRGGQGVRAGGFFRGIREMQMLNPLASVGGAGGLVEQLGSYSANTGAQQKAMMLTGGAMGMIAGGGGRQKTLSEWAESILRWFEGLRPGDKKGKGFDYGELMAQYFPGSNIDAWFNATGVTQEMRDYWWTYALGKARRTPDTSTKGFQIGTDEGQMGPSSGNVAWQRLRAGSEITRSEFGLAGQMAGQYANREGSNRWFNELLGQVMNKIIPLLSKGPLAAIQYLPDSIEDLLMTGTERGMSELLGGGDIDNGIGDIGDAYGAMGGTGLSGLHPDMKSKVGAMMRANPRVTVNSGLRDTGLQQRLKAAGHSRVSGKPSAHTRGMAADLGPKSEYGWIAKNAGRFGLASGKSHGEPWHVGMKGDIPGLGDIDIGEPTAFDNFIGAIKGGGSVEGMANIITSLLDWMTKGVGKLTGGGAVQDVKTDPDGLYKKLAGLSQDKMTLGKVSKDDLTGRGGGATTSTSAPAANLPAADAAAGIAAATALYNAGFKNKSDLETITAISWRESRWDPTRKNPRTSDRGLMQINMASHGDLMRQMGYSEADLLDIQKNANMAYRLWSSGGANQASFQQLWGFSEHSRFTKPPGQPGWDSGGDPLGNTQGSSAPAIVASANLPGIGDVEMMQAQTNMSAPTSRGVGMSFNNTFNLSVPTYGSGGSGGIDVRQTVTLIADHLEQEMSRRMKRSA
jgi:hypothetical protein